MTQKYPYEPPHWTDLIGVLIGGVFVAAVAYALILGVVLAVRGLVRLFI